MTTTTYRKEICYDRETRDYAMYLDSELVGFGRTYHDAEVQLDQLVFELLSDGHFATATDLAEHGLVDDVPAALEAEHVSSTHLPSWQPTVCALCECTPCDCSHPHHTWQCPDCGAKMRQTRRGATLAKRGPAYVCPVSEAKRGTRLPDDPHTYVHAWTADELAAIATRQLVMDECRREVSALPVNELRARYLASTGESKPPRGMKAGDYIEHLVLGALNVHMAKEVDGGAVEMPSTCQNCQGPHHIQDCPQIKIVLFAPPHCSQCGDPMDLSGAGLCHLCRDWSEPVVVVVDVEYAPFGFAA